MDFPRVVATSLAPDEGAIQPTTSLDVTFNRAMDPASFATGDAGILSREAPSIEELGSLGGVVQDCEVLGNTLYAVTGAELQIFDVSDAKSPQEIGQFHISGDGTALQVVEDLAYVAVGTSGLEIVDVHDSAHPVQVGQIGGFNASEVQVVGGLAFVAGGAQGMHIVDVSNPASPVRLATSQSAANAVDVEVVGNVAYVADQYVGLVTVDVSTPTAPTVLGRFDSTGLRGLDADGDRVYLVDSSQGLLVLDAADPAAPSLIGDCYLHAPSDVQVVDNLACVALDGAIRIVDVTTPTSPVIRGSWSGECDHDRVRVAGHRAYFFGNEGGISILDVARWSPPSSIGSLNELGYSRGVQTVGDRAYVASSHGLTILDVSTPSAPSFVGSLDRTYGIAALKVVGHTAYVVGSGSGFEILDVANPTRIVRLGGLHSTFPYDFQVLGNLAYFVDSTGLEIVDVANPSAPSLCGSVAIATGPHAVAVNGNYAYVACAGRELQIFDVSNPNAPVRLSSLSTSDAAYDVQVVGNLAYVAAAGKGMLVVDVSNASSPVALSSFYAGSGSQVDVCGDLAYVAGNCRLALLDVSNPAAPALIDRYETPGYCESVCVVGRQVYVADGSDGLRILETGNSPTQVTPQSETSFRLEFAEPLTGGTNWLLVGPDIEDISGNPMDQDGDGQPGERREDADEIRFDVKFSPSHTCLTNSTILEGLPDGTAIGTLVSLDPDSTGPFAYALVNGQGDDGNSSFILEGDQLRAAEVFDVDRQAEYSVRVRATDSDGLWNETAMVIHVLDAGPRIISTDPALDRGPVCGNAVTVTFSEPIAPATLEPSDVGLLSLDVPECTSLARLQGPFYDGELQGNLLYVATAQGIEVYDVANPASPRVVARWEGTGDDSADGSARIQITGPRAYLVNNGTFQIVDIATPEAPALLGLCHAGAVADAFVAGDQAYLAVEGEGLKIFDISNPAVPVALGSFAMPTATRVYVHGDVAYVSGESNLVLLDVANPTAPTLVATYAGWWNGIDIVDHTAYLTGPSIELCIVDISTPQAPQTIGIFQTYGSSQAVQVVGDRAYVACGQSGLLVVDVSTPFVPKLVGALDTSGLSYAVSVCDNVAYVIDGPGGFLAVDLSGTGPLTPLGGVTTPVHPEDVQIVGNLAYVADAVNGLVILDVTNPAAPVGLSRCDSVYYASGVEVVGNLAYVVGGSSGFQIVDVRDPRSPAPVGGFDTSGCAYSLQVMGNLAYVADGSDGLLIFDVTDPAKPVLLGGYQGANCNAVDLQVVGQVAYLADSNAGMQILDVSNPKSPAILGTYTIRQGAERVEVASHWAYVIGEDLHLYLVDVATAATPTLRSTSRNHVTDVEVAGDIAYVAQFGFGVGVLDVTDPQTPREFSLLNVETYGEDFRIRLAGNVLYAVVDGLSVLQVGTSVTGIEQVTGNTYRLEFGERFSEGMQLWIGPDVRDTSGTLLDQDQDGVRNETGGDLFSARFTAAAAASPALFDPEASTFYLRSSNSSGPADYTFGYGQPGGGWQVLTGDWDGNGSTDVGHYDPQASVFYLTRQYVTGDAVYTFGYGVAGAGWIPLVGDWNADGKDGVGLYDPTHSTFYLTDNLQTGYAQHTFGFGAPDQEWIPLVGDWDCQGRTGVGLYDPNSSMFYLTSAFTTGFAEHTFGYGQPGAGWLPLVGDWDGDGRAGVGLYASQSSSFYLTSDFVSGFAQYTFGFGEPGAGWKPLVGDWNGNGADGVGLYSPSSSFFYLSNVLVSGWAEYSVGFGPADAGWQPLVGCWGQGPTLETASLPESTTPNSVAIDQLDLAAIASAALTPFSESGAA